MKFIVIVLCHLSICCYGQFNTQKGHVWIKYGAGFDKTTSYQQIGFSGEWLLRKRFGLNYNLEFFARKDGISQIHSSVGALAGPPLILYGLVTSLVNTMGMKPVGSLGVILGIVVLVAPDGVCYHFPIGYHWDVAPYVNLLGVDFLDGPQDQSGRLKWSTSYGVKGTYWRSNGITLNAFAETRQVASLPWGFGAGFGIGYAIGSNKEEEVPTFDAQPLQTSPTNKEVIQF